MNIPDHFPLSLETVLKILKFFDPDPEYRIFFYPGSGMKKFESGGSATLQETREFV
jgi:hypothetical protein